MWWYVLNVSVVSIWVCLCCFLCLYERRNVLIGCKGCKSVWWYVFSDSLVSLVQSFPFIFLFLIVLCLDTFKIFECMCILLYFWCNSVFLYCLYQLLINLLWMDGWTRRTIIAPGQLWFLLFTSVYVYIGEEVLPVSTLVTSGRFPVAM